MKPFIASSVSPAPTLPPPLVLPSEIRRNSMAQNGSRSRSASSSPAPTQGLKKTATEPAKPAYNPYLGSAPKTYSLTQRSHLATNSSFSSPPKASTMSSAAAPRSKSMTSASTLQRQTFQPVRAASAQAQPTAHLAAPGKPSFGQKLKKVFSFARKPSDIKSSPAATPKKEKSERTFSLSFSKKSRANTMNNTTVRPEPKTKKDTGRSMTMSTMNYDNNAAAETSSIAPTFEGFDSVFDHGRRKSRSGNMDSDAVSIRSTTSVSSFATLKKMGTSFSKGTKNLFHKSGPKPAASQEFESIPAAAAAAPVFKEPVQPVLQNSNPEQTSRTLSLVTPSALPAADLEAPSFASSTSIASSSPQTPTRNDADSVVTDAASTIKVSNTSLDDTLAVPNPETESDEDLNMADTVFPKNLDSATVEIIRSSLDRTKSLERRRSRRSNRSAKSSQWSENVGKRSTLEDVSTHSILKASTSFEELPESQSEKPAFSKNRASFKASPSIASIFNFGDSDLDLDLNFNFAPAVAADLETEAKKYKSSLKAKPKDYSVTESHAPEAMQKRYQQMDHHRPARSTSSQGYYHPLYHRSTSSSGSVPKANPGSTVSFSSRIIIFDTYDATDYDRRAEIATCNRLNPMLAQQIREELNTFKMEMNVHAESRIYTHFY